MKPNQILRSTLTCTTALSVLLSCAPKTPELASNAPADKAASEFSQPTITTTPKVDILFVIDNAEAMSAHQENLSKQIDAFANEIKSSGSQMDYHIGVTSLFDHTRWVKGAPDCDYDNGQLRTLKHMIPDPANPGKQKEEVLSDRNFVTNSDPDVVGILKDTLVLGEQPFHKCGYKFEEKFGPVKAALQEPMLSGANKGFYRPDAELAVIFVSDADDETQDMTSENMKDVLLTAKNNKHELVSVFAVTTSADANDHSCPRDNDGPPVKLHELVDKMNGRYLSLCDSNFGSQLAGFARLIRQRALMKVIPLSKVPDLTTVEVRYGGALVSAGAKGWVYDIKSHAIVISPEVFKDGASAGITVDYVAVDMQNAFSHEHVHVAGQ